LKTVYENGNLLYDDDDIKAVDTARSRLLETLQFVDLETRESEKTKRIHQAVRARFMNGM